MHLFSYASKYKDKVEKSPRPSLPMKKPYNSCEFNKKEARKTCDGIWQLKYATVKAQKNEKRKTTPSGYWQSPASSPHSTPKKKLNFNNTLDEGQLHLSKETNILIGRIMHKTIVTQYQFYH